MKAGLGFLEARRENFRLEWPSDTLFIFLD